MEVLEREFPTPPQPVQASHEQQLEGFIVGIVPKGSKEVIAVQGDKLVKEEEVLVEEVEGQPQEDDKEKLEEAAEEDNEEDTSTFEESRSILDTDFFMQVGSPSFQVCVMHGMELMRSCLA